MRSTQSLLASLGRAGIKVDVTGDRLRLTGNLAALTDDMKESLRAEKTAILTTLSVPTYPNSEGLVKCCYCTLMDGYRCNKGHHPDGIALLRECGDFSFSRKEQVA